MLVYPIRLVELDLKPSGPKLVHTFNPIDRICSDNSLDDGRGRISVNNIRCNRPLSSRQIAVEDKK
ncbi:hypothetical protein [Allorhodopirellula heiligendammensis]|uniref:hypothetical protein n=1 Tax=Allorhodopirellula heiligendammensis TaxID=2714739 RepID=UPI0011B54643|nr:hypothetical protein [Allorhodopirellula heiligendammensis]